jgi:hypothetical protein
MSLAKPDINDILKEQYPEGLDETLVMKNHKLLPLMKRRKDFYGRHLHVPIQYGKPQGRSKDFATAQANEYSSNFEGFDITHVSDYGVGRLEGHVVDSAAGGDAAKFVDHLKNEIDGCLSTLGDTLAKEAYRGTGGARGVVGSVSTTSLTLADPEDVVFFEVGMELQADTVDGGGTVHVGTATITAINRDTGVLTSDSNWTSQITGLAANDYLFQQGDYDACAAGVAAWIPSTAPTATAFFGVDRSVDSERLGGIRFDGSSYTMDDVFIRAEARAARSNAKITHFFANPVDVADLKAVLEDRKRVIDVETYYNGVGFKGIKICDGQAGEIPLISDPDCPVNRCYGLDMNCWTWATMGEAPRVIDSDGLQFERLATSDAYEVRTVARHNFYTQKPGGHMTIALPTS